LEIEIFTNVLKDILGGGNKIEIPEGDSINLKKLFEFLARNYGRELLERLFDGENLRPEIILRVNETAVDSQKCMDIEVQSGDRIVIQTAMAGG